MAIQQKPNQHVGNHQDTLYQQMGGWETCQRLSEHFHDRVAHDPVLSTIFPKNLAPATERLALLLAERLGGPADYTARRGKQSLVCRHAHLAIGSAEAESWLENMFAAMEEIGIPEPARTSLHNYFTETVPTLSDPFLPFYHLPLDELRTLLEQNPALAAASEHGHTLLSNAALQWDVLRVEMLLKYGADVHVVDRLGHCPLYQAVRTHPAAPEEAGCSVVELLIRHGADINRQSGPGRSTPLHMAARRGHVALAEALIRAGAEREIKDSKGETPLRRAVNCGQEKMVECLLAHGANPLSQDKLGRTALDAARQPAIRQALQQATDRYLFAQEVQGLTIARS